MSDPIIRGPKLPLAWSTVAITGYVNEKTDEDIKVDAVELEDETSQVVTEVTGLRLKTDFSIEVWPLSTVSSPPVVTDIFTWGSGGGAKKMSIRSIKKSRAKGNKQEMWTLSGVFLPLVHV